MIEKIVLDYLTDLLDVKVFMEYPKSAPTSFVLLEKTGSGQKGRGLYEATIAIQSYGSSMYQAAKLNEKVKVAMQDIVNLSDVSKVTLNSDYNYTDTSTKQYRYQAVFDLVHY